MQKSCNDSANAFDALVTRHARADGERTAIVGDAGEVTYARLASAAGCVSRRLTALGIDPEQRVALMVDDSPELVFWLMGAFAHGAVAVPLNTFADAELLNFYLNDCRARLLVADLRYREVVDAARRAGVPHLSHVVWVDDEQYGEAGDPFAVPFAVDPDDSAVWLYTSGSTSRPKAAMHRHASLLNAAENYGRHVLGIRPEDRTYSTSKLFFAYGLGNSVLFPFSVGASTLLVKERASAAGVVDNLCRYRPTLMFSVPALYNHLADSAVLDADCVSSVRLCLSAGEYLPQAVFDKWHARTGLTILDGLGSTEATHIFCSNTPESVTPGTSGRAVAGYELRIVDEQGIDVATGEVGMLLVKGDTLAKGYWNRHRIAQSAFRGEWLATGDLYRQDEEGRYIYVGRQDDAFKVSGLWVSPVEIEQSLLEHPEVEETAVIGVKDENGLTRARAFVVRRAGTAAGEGDEDLATRLGRHLEGRLPKYKLPREIEEVVSLPRTATGKIARGRLRDAVNDAAAGA